MPNIHSSTVFNIVTILVITSIFNNSKFRVILDHFNGENIMCYI